MTPVADCSPLQEEMQDVQSYRAFIPAVAGPSPASTALVVFHNLVTASVSNVAYLQGAARRLFCVKDVLQSVGSTFGADVPAPAVGPAAQVPGLMAQHRLLACPP
mmetsp:Transcript_7250/g.20097  ORF Transcript_7250/g.20097 Transcript_7250/m.20097 type:complete len:105 (+) Transcript_7250:490-804(+)